VKTLGARSTSRVGFRPAGLASVLLVLATATAAADEPKPTTKPVTERSKLEIKPSEKAIGSIAIDNPLGDVRVEGYDGKSLLIETVKTAPTGDALERLRVSLVPNPDGSVRITTAADPGDTGAIARAEMKIDLVVRAPRDAKIEATSSAGLLQVSNMDAGGILDTATGRIRVINVQGELTTSTVSGETRIEQAFGSIDAQTLGADVSLDSIAGTKLVASANRGSIAGRRVRSREIELTTTDGSISLEAEVTLRSRVVVASLKGDVDMKLRRTGAMMVRARGAKVNLGSQAGTKTQSDGWLTATFGAAGGTDAPAFVEMRSKTGTVQLHLIESD